MADNKSSMLEGGNKQKIIIVAVLVIVFIIIWQASSLFSGGSTPAPAAPAPVAPTPMSPGAPTPLTPTTPRPAMGNAGPGAAMPASISSPTQGSAATQAQIAPSQAVQIDPEQLQKQRENEKKYIQAVNDLQMLKIQKEIADTNLAITNSKLDTITSEKKLSDLLVGPVHPPVAEGMYVNNLVAPAIRGQSKSSAADAGMDVSYVVLSVSKKDNQWGAVIANIVEKVSENVVKKQETLFSVTVGENLPPDGSLVVSIDKNGVVLQKDGVRRRLQIRSTL
ncbi:MAG: hypothetical protein P4M12_00560 [Gammaproteobacteria bacterium]|nr:hypothetical protein [Gammaproteobacteria bacterium]